MSVAEWAAIIMGGSFVSMLGLGATIFVIAMLATQPWMPSWLDDALAMATRTLAVTALLLGVVFVGALVVLLGALVFMGLASLIH